MGARLAGVCAILAVLAIPADSQARGCAGAHVKAKASNTAKVAGATACLVNRQRVKHGLKPLRVNRKLAAAATRHSQEMVAQRFFDHIDPDGTTPVDRAMAAHYIKPDRAWYIAENIGIVSGHRGSAAEQVRDWMHSEGHRANILTKEVRDVGIGVAIGDPMGGRGGATYTLEVGRSS
jgi:uncharacterized protein YkwD